MMALFRFGKKNEKKKVCGCTCSVPKQVENQDECRIKVLGAGCKSCHAMYENAMKAASAHGLCGEVAYITDLPKVTAYGVMKLPALVIDEKVVSQGKVLKASEIEPFLRDWS